MIEARKKILTPIYKLPPNITCTEYGYKTGAGKCENCGQEVTLLNILGLKQKKEITIIFKRCNKFLGTYLLMHACDCETIKC